MGTVYWLVLLCLQTVVCQNSYRNLWGDGQACNCNGFSNRCYFDSDLYGKTGHGGHCLDCTNNRAGPNCERCQDNYYERYDGVCEACNCNEVGSRSLQCGADGTCQCRPGVVGDKCDRCEENYYDFSTQGCKPCGCNVAGSYLNRPSCDPRNGICGCKLNVEGQQCDTCKPGYFNLDENNEFGCTPCFCYGHSSICNSASGFSQATIESRFVRGEERWTAVDLNGRNASLNYSPIDKSIGVAAQGRQTVYFSAPSRFLGNQRASYNHDLTFTLRVAELGPQSSSLDVVLEGNGLSVSTTIFTQGNDLPNTQNQVYTFRLHEDGSFSWSPRLSSRDFMALLSNLTSIKIRGTYVPEGRGYLDNVSLDTVRQGFVGDAATWIESCTCPEGYVGQFCESCAPGYRHDPPNGGPFASCILCDCNNHADICDAESGKCICQHNTAGNQCERCARGYYGNALQGTPNDCEPCPCPDGGACLTLFDESVVCLECPEGYTGPRCQLCTDGYFGDKTGLYGAPRPCEKCDCNGNIDSNAVSNCNRTTGQCLKCIYNTGGYFCEECLSGYFGDALALPKGDCQACRCNSYGTVAEAYGPPVCDQFNGQCNCKPHVTGRTCDRCEAGYWNLTGGEGCQPCECDLTGSENSVCDPITGQCPCRSGVVGRNCDSCQQQHYGFSEQGCDACECDPIGSLSLQCDSSGQCPCRDNVEQRRCDRCRENTYDKQAGCRDCPPCYTLVLDAVSIHRERLAELERLLSDIVSNPTVLNDKAFENSLTEVLSEVDNLWKNTKLAATSGGESTVEQHLKELKDRIAKVRDLLREISDLKKSGNQLAQDGRNNVGEAEIFIEKARDALRQAEVYLDVEGQRALDKAIESSKKFGQQSNRMSDIAREARKLAQEHEDQAKTITKNAYEAHNISEDAYNLVRKAIDDQNNITQVIKGLETQLQTLAVRHKATLDSAAKALEDARIVYKEALNISTTTSSLAVPRLNATGLEAEATDIEEQARRLLEQLEQLMTDRTDLLLEIEIQLEKTRGLKEKGLEQQQITAGLLADVFNAKTEAEQAVQKADKTLEEAQETLRTLQGFDKKVQESRGAAEAALQRVDDIEATIEKAELLTEDARNAMQGAESDAKRARDLAINALNTAESASELSGDVLNKADDIKQRATELKDQSDDIARRVAETEAELSLLEAQAQEDRDRVSEAQQKANTAKTRSEKASNRVTEAYELVREIVQLLENAINLDTSELDELERRLAEAERMYRTADIEGSTRDLKKSRNWQERQIASYEEELRLLKIEVDNINEIREVLPDGCFRQSRLET